MRDLCTCTLNSTVSTEMVPTTANFHLRPLQPTDNEVVRELWSTAMRSYRMPPERRWDDWITKRLEDPGDMGDPHKGYIVHALHRESRW